jgi:hypothetical protein
VARGELMMKKLFASHKKVVQHKRSDELAFDVLGLDGVWLPLKTMRRPF